MIKKWSKKGQIYWIKVLEILKFLKFNNNKFSPNSNNNSAYNLMMNYSYYLKDSKRYLKERFSKENFGYCLAKLISSNYNYISIKCKLLLMLIAIFPLIINIFNLIL